MKYLSYTLLIVGCIVMLFTIYIMFHASDYRDKDFVLSLFSGITITFIGFTIETYNTNAYTRFQRAYRRKQLRTSSSVVILSGLMVLISLIWL
jgi:uncharacterized membrane protein YidH (DUF202 family)